MKDTDVEEIVDTVLNQLPRYCLTKNDGEWGLKRIEQGAYADVSDLDEVLREALKQAEARGAEREKERIFTNPIIVEFIEATKIWYEELAPAFKKGKCIMCGRKIQGQKDLLDTLEALNNKSV